MIKKKIRKYFGKKNILYDIIKKLIKFIHNKTIKINNKINFIK